MLAAALCSFGAAAQSVTVVLNDGTQKKFGVDYVKEITFQEASSGEKVEFTNLGVEPYGGGNVELSFTTADGARLVCDTYGPSTATYLMPGVYTVKADGEFRVDSGQYSSYSKDGISTTLASGSMTVSNDGPVYTIDVDINLTDGSNVAGTWSGELSAYSQYVEKTLNNAAYNANPGKAGEFYVKFNDTNYTVEMAIDFFGDPADTTLAPGTYVYSPEGGDMTFGPNSYVDIYNPTSNNRMSQGIITVEKEGNEYTIDMNLTFQDTRIATITFKGEISGTPTFETNLRNMPRRPAKGLRTIKIK